MRPWNDNASALPAALVAEAGGAGGWRRELDELDAGRRILRAAPDVQLDALAAAVEQWSRWPRAARPLLRQLARRVLRRGLTLDEPQLCRLVGLAAARPWALPLSAVVGVVERSLAGRAPSPELSAALLALREVLAPQQAAHFRALAARVSRLMSGGAWRASDLLAELETMAPELRRAWEDAIAHARSLRSARPSARWRARAAALGREFGDGRRLAAWLRSAAEASGALGGPMLAADAELLSGLAGIAATLDDPEIIAALGALAEAALRKVVGRGPWSARVANACIRALAATARPEAVAELSRLRSVVRYRVPRRLIDEALDAMARSAGVTVAELEDASVPDFGIHDGVLQRVIDGVTAELRIADDGRVRLRWRDRNGGAMRSIPALVQREHAAEVADLRRTARAVGRTLTAVRRRLDQLAAFERVWSFAGWTATHRDHPLVATVARRLIWEIGDRSTPALLVGWDRDRAGLVGVDGAPVSPEAQARVRLWHPVRSDAGTIAAWRRWLEERHIMQPFPQAHRALYRLDPAEHGRSVVERFAGRVLYQHQLAALCRQYGWRYALAGAGFAVGRQRATLTLQPWRLQAELEVRPVEDPGEMSTAGAWFLVRTGRLVFRTPNGATLPLQRVPPLIYSEVLRDVARIVDVSTLGVETESADVEHADRRPSSVA